MTHDEELLLKGYLRLDGDAFDDWLHETRDGTIDGRARLQGGPCPSAGMAAGFPGKGLRRAPRGWRNKRTRRWPPKPCPKPPCRRRRRRVASWAGLQASAAATRKVMIPAQGVIDDDVGCSTPIQVGMVHGRRRGVERMVDEPRDGTHQPPVVRT